MNPRQRYLETLLFGRPDRVPLDPGHGRKSTRAAWHEQGLPAEIDDMGRIAEYAYRLNGGALEWPRGGEDFPVNTRMIPEFEEKVLSRSERTQIVQDWKGNICEISNEYTTEYLRNAIDFVTRRWIKCPVQSRSDWDDMKWRYDPDDPARYPADAVARAARLKDRAWPISINISGPFWQLREWLGFENLCMAFKDDPAFVKEMIAFWSDFVARVLENTLRQVALDEVHLSEDMAYKSFSMISPAMTRAVGRDHPSGRRAALWHGFGRLHRPVDSDLDGSGHQCVRPDRGGGRQRHHRVPPAVWPAHGLQGRRGQTAHGRRWTGHCG